MPTFSSAQSPNWVWAKGAGGTKSDYAYSVTADASGNIYMAGEFTSSTLTFGSTTLNNAGSSDMFLVKYDASGNVLLATSAGGSSVDKVYSVAADVSGNIYVAGEFTSSTIIFGSTTLTNVGNKDMFLVKYDASGNVLWAKSSGGSSADYAFSVTADASGNILMTGLFESPTITFGSTTLTLTNAGLGNMFLVKYNASGNVLWAKSAGGIYGDWASSVTTDVSGNIYVAGLFGSPNITFGSTTLNNAGGLSYDMFLVKYDASGNVIWAKSAGGINDDWVTSIIADASGNLYLAGHFGSSTLTFGSTTLNKVGVRDIFLVKCDASGNALWAKSAGGSSYNIALSVAADASGNVYLAGYFDSPTVTFCFTTLTNAGSNDMFLVKYDASGNVLWAKSAGGSSYDDVYSVTTDASGNIYVAGFFNSSSITFGSTTLNTTGAVGYDDMFIAKLDGLVIDIEELKSGNDIVVYPNPFSNSTTISFTLSKNSNVKLNIYDIKGRLIQMLADKEFSQGEHHINFSAEHLSTGVYYCALKSDEAIETRKMILIK